MKRVLLTVLAFFVLAGHSLAAPVLKEEVKNGNVLYNEGSFEEALEEYEKALLNSPDSDVVNFNMGAALYKLGEYKAATSHLEKALVSENENLEQKASYNIANAKYLYGMRQEDINIENAANILEQSLRHYEHALGLNTKDEDAQHNHKVVKKDLDRIREKMKQEKEKQEKKEEDFKEEQRSISGREREEEQEEEQMTGAGGKQEQQGEKGEEQDQAEALEEEIKDTRGSKEEGLKSQSGEETGEGSASEELEEETEGKPEGKPSEQLSGVEALGILNNYSQEEEPRGLYKEKLAISRTAPVIKDW